ncbi:MAG TPA: hypothetical protein VEB42_02365, partial [Chitinophagaceae bacterium]|nr:hypothetical protein [Chitinophagaceae bacterium]
METVINRDHLQSIAAGFGLRHAYVEALGSGLIHYTYKAEADGQAIVLQQINTKVFAEPQALIRNYLIIYD